MTDSSVYRARNLSRFAGEVWELRVAERPSFVDDLVHVPLEGDAVHLLGGDAQTLAGESAQWVLRDLAPLLDGTRTLADLLALRPEISEPQLRDVLHFLQMHGMLEDAEDAASPEWRASAEERFGAQMAYFSRYLRLTGLFRNRYQVQHALESAAVGVLGDPSVTDVVCELLQTAGVGTVRRMDTHALASSPSLVLLVILADASTQEAVARLARSAPSPPRACLFVDPFELVMGPLTVFGSSACPTCVRLQLPLDPAEYALSPQVLGLFRHAFASRAAQHAIAYVTGLHPSAALEHIERWRPEQGTSAFHPQIARLPSCPTCGRACTPYTMTLRSGHRENRALFFHGASMMQPWHIKQPAGMQGHLTPKASKVTTHAYLENENATRVALSGRADARSTTFFNAPAERALTESASLRARVDHASLAAILRSSFGGSSFGLEDGGRAFVRATASAGNLGSPEAYVLAFDVPGLPPGLYHYSLRNDALEELRVGDLSRALMDTVTREVWHEHLEGAQAVLGVVSAVARVCAKYDARGFPWAIVDAGHVCHRVDLLAAQVGVALSFVSEFSDDALSRLLGVDGFDLAPMMLLALKGGP